MSIDPNDRSSDAQGGAPGAGERLRRDELHYRALFEDNPQPMWVYDLQTLRFLAVNDAAVALYGYSREEFLDRTILDIRPEGDRPELRRNLAQPSTRIEHSGPWRHRLRNGGTILVDIASHALDFDGRAARLVIVTDVTARLHAQEALRASEERFRQLAENITQVFWLSDPRARRLLYVSPAYSHIWGRPPDAVYADPLHWLDAIVPADRERVAAAMQAQATGGYAVEYRIARPDGTQRWIHDRGFPVRDAQGEVYRIAGVAEDITDRKRAEEALHKKDSLLRIAGKVARVGGWAVEPGVDRVYWSDEIYDLLEYPRGAPLTVEQTLELVVQPPGEAVAAALAHCLKTGEPFDLDIQLRTATGRLIWTRCRGEAEVSPTGGITHAQGALQDITVQKGLEEQLRQSQRLESVGQLTGGVAHDFNNLLTVILGNAGMLIEFLEDDERLRPLAEMIRTAAERGAALTHHLLAFARKQALNPRAVDVNRLLGDMGTLLHRALGEHIEMRFALGAGVQPAMVDPGQLENAVLNLCLNARDAMPQGGRLMIETSAARLDADYAQRAQVPPGDYVMVAVSDNGAGIAPEHLPRVFEPFFTTKEKARGTGLGLAMVYGFIKQSGGHVSVYSEPGHGTTVRMYLPLASPRAAQESDAGADKNASGGSETILLVEDDELVRLYVRKELSSLGYRVIEAEDGPTALGILSTESHVDLLFTDVVMPGGLTGKQLADEACALRPGLKVLFTSGYTEDAIVHHGRLDPGVQLLSKPYQRADLARAVRSALDRTRT